MEQNTNRMWWTIGIIVLGSILIGGFTIISANELLPKVSSTFERLAGNKTIDENDPKWIEKR